MRLAIVLWLAVGASADVVYLKNGNQLEGAVQSETQGEVVLDIGFGTMNLRRADIARIKRSSPRQRRALRRKHRKEHFESGRWVPKGFEPLFAGLQDLRGRREKAMDAKHRRQSLMEERDRLTLELDRLDRRAKDDAFRRIYEIGQILSVLEADMQGYLSAFRAFRDRLAQAAAPSSAEEREYRAQLDKSLAEMDSDFDADAVDSRREGPHLIVPVLFNGSVRGRLMVDTGASVTSVTPELAARIQRPGPDDRIATLTLGDGRRVKTRQFRASAIEVGRSRVENSALVALPAPGPGVDGLLGMSFLGNFSVEVDHRNGKLILNRLK